MLEADRKVVSDAGATRRDQFSEPPNQVCNVERETR